MNNDSVIVRVVLRAKRKLLTGVCCTLLCVGAILLVVLYRAGETEIPKMRAYNVHVYGECPECHKPIEADLERFCSDRIWDGRVWNKTVRLSPRGRPCSGFDYIFECPVCDAKISAAVEFYGKETRANPYGEYTRVWGLGSEAAREALIRSLSGKTNSPSGSMRGPDLTMTNGVGIEARGMNESTTP
jgi:hypothetical protein